MKRALITGITGQDGSYMAAGGRKAHIASEGGALAPVAELSYQVPSGCRRASFGVKEHLKMSFWAGKSVVVTGGSGFLGHFVVQELREKNCQGIFVPGARSHQAV